MDLLTPATSADEAQRAAKVAVLPVGSFEQHGAHLPLITDTIVASAIARRISSDYDLFLLPPITIACSHEHARFAGTVSISAATLFSVIRDIVESLAQAGVDKLVIVNGHGGNYVLSNVVQQSNLVNRKTILFPGQSDWTLAREQSGCLHDNHSDMHAGEAETSILLSVTPHLVREGWKSADFAAVNRPDFLLIGTDGYSPTGVIGYPSAATANKGEILIRSLSLSFEARLRELLA